MTGSGAMGDGTEAEAGPATCAADRLPDELLLLLWEYVELHDMVAVAGVCRRWRRLAARRALRVRRREDLQRVRPALRMLLVTARGFDMAAALARARCLHTLIVHKRVPLEDAALRALDGLPLLAHLDVFTWTQRLDDRLLPAASRLRTLVINETVMPNLLRHLADSSRLEQLHMYGRTRFFQASELGALLAARSDHFTELTLRCRDLKDAAYEAIGRCANLVVLRLYACWMLREPVALSVVSLPKLRVLHVNGARMLFKQEMLNMVQALPVGLEELSLSDTCFGNTHMTALKASVPNLRLLELWNMNATMEALSHLVMQLPRLRELNTSLPMGPCELEELLTHPSLVKLSCARVRGISEPDFQRQAGRLAPVATPHAHYARGTMRSDGAGWASGLFYHWFMTYPPRPLPTDAQKDNSSPRGYTAYGVSELYELFKK